MLASERLDGWTAVFLAATVLTSLSGFGFPFPKLLPSHVVGIISLVDLARSEDAISRSCLVALFADLDHVFAL